MSIDISDVELLIKCGRIICNITKGDENIAVFIQKISEELGIEESKTRDILRIGQQLGMVTPITSNQVKIGPFGREYFCH